MRTVLAFDFDGINGKVFIGRFNGRRICYEKQKQFNIESILENRQRYWDFFSLVDEVKKTIGECGDIDSVAFDAWGNDYGLLVGRDYLMHLPFAGSVAGNKNVPRRIFKKISQEELFRATGNQSLPTNTLFQLMEEKGKALDSKNMLFMSDLFAWALCGSRTVDRTIASISQLLNPLTGEWNYNITLLTPFSFLLFPEIVDPGTICGSYKGIAVAKVAGHNIQSAIAAMPCSESEDTVFLYDGMSPVIGCELDNPILTKMGMDMGLSNAIGANGKFNCLKNIHGRKLVLDTVQALNAKGEECSDYDVAQMVEQEPVSSCFIDTDALELFDSNNLLERIGLYCEQTGQIAPKTNAEYVRCVYDSLAMKYRRIIEQIHSLTGKEFKAFHILGDGATDPIFCQTIANYLGIPVVAGPVEAAALGNIMLQLIALREVENVASGRKLIRRYEKTTTYYPQSENVFHEKYQLFYEILYGRNKC